jgi:putative restriction endonuclease
MTDFPLLRNLEIGENFTQEEVENLFQTDFGYQFKGITYRRPDEGKYIILMANEGEFYNDEIGSGSDFIYEGEGDPEKGDQQLTNANQELRNAITDPIPIYFFQSEEGIDEYEYQGIVEVIDSRYVSDGQRMVYKFDIQKLGVPAWEDVEEVETEISESTEKEPQLREHKTGYTTNQRKTRSSVFARKVKQQYDYSCAICGARRFSPAGNPEVEAAHIYPKSEDGSDDLRNGLALCRLHHWAFDSGWIAISDDLTVLVNNSVERAPPESIQQLEGKRVQKPNDSSYEPHPVFLQGHRELQGLG